MRGDALLGFTLTNTEGLIRDVQVRGSFGCSDHEVAEFRITRGGNTAKNRIAMLDFRKADFDLFRDLNRRIM